MPIDATFFDIHKDWHEEINEDGVRRWHPGYEVLMCQFCDKPYMQVKGFKGDIRSCGRARCDDKARNLNK